MILEAVTVCVGYADFLAETAKFNAHLFDKWTIVTEPSDNETQKVCRTHRLHCLVSNDGQREGPFAKGRLVERGLQHMSADCWRLHIDADIVLPAFFRRHLDDAHLDEQCIHGVDRVMVRSWEEWQKLLATGWPHSTQPNPYCANWPQGFTIGSRWASHAGWVPIGFFQLWHSSHDEKHGVRVKPYPSKHGTACRTDVQHALQWDRRQRVLIPEIIAVHLESEPAKNGINWQGRKTKRFGPAAPKTASDCPS